MTKYQAGDIILTRNNIIWSNIIFHFMKIFQKDPVEYSHVLITADRTRALNSNIYGLHFVDIETYLKNCKKYKIIRLKEFTFGESLEINNFCESLNSLHYSKTRICLQILDHIFNTNKFTSLSKNPKDQVCSSSVAWIYWEILRIKFNDVDWYNADPDDIDDESILNSNKWEVIVKKG